MDPQGVLLEILDDADRRIHELLETTPEDGLGWLPDAGANSIGVLIWHVARVLDVFLTCNIRGLNDRETLWFSNKWDDTSGYDPSGLGTNGWGMLTGYSREEVEAIPQMSKDVLGGYYNQVSEAIRDYLNKTEMEELEKPSIRFEGRQPNWFWVRHPLLDMTRHVGEMLALKGQWEREMGLGLDTS